MKQSSKSKGMTLTRESYIDGVNAAESKGDHRCAKFRSVFRASTVPDIGFTAGRSLGRVGRPRKQFELHWQDQDGRGALFACRSPGRRKFFFPAAMDSESFCEKLLSSPSPTLSLPSPPCYPQHPLLKVGVLQGF